MTNPRPRRSVLYVPGSRPRALEKVRSLPVDAVIFDLEDAVAPDEKAEAREAVRAALGEGGYGGRETVVRINPLSGPWGTEDLMAAIAARADAVLIPKVDDADDIRQAAAGLTACDADDHVDLWAMMETPAAILKAEEIAATARENEVPLTCLVLGTNDLAKETRAALRPGRGPMLSWIATVVLAARAHGLDVIDGVFNALDDATGFDAECRQGSEMGLDGKTLIHPSQISSANTAFAPDAEAIARARDILAAFERPENSGKGVIRLDGEMVERLHAEMAARTVAIAEAIAARAGAGS